MTSNKNQKMTYFIWILVYALVITLVSINTVKISPYTLLIMMILKMPSFI